MSELPTETAYEEQQSNTGDGLFRMYWLNGNPQLKTGGRFWIGTDKAEAAELTLPAPWSVVSHTFKRGATSDIWVADELKIAPISWRQQNFWKNEDGGVESWIEEKRFGKLEQNEGIAFELLCLVQGVDIPMVLSVKSSKASMAWAANILPDYRKMRDAVKKSRGAKVIPPWWFWLTVRAPVIGKDKKPHYEVVKGSTITPMTWIVADDYLENRETWKSMYVGADVAAMGERVYVDTGKAWATKRISEGYTIHADQDAPETNGRNVPQAYTEDEAPF